MKKFIFAAIMLLVVCGNCVNAQEVKREGNTFSFVSNGRSKAPKDTLQTQYDFADSKGNHYPIVINKSSGRCYIWKTSSKTGKLYKQYMKEEISREVCKLVGITYVEKKENK